jgi:capsular polysaccharide biosynthesis protein
VGAASTALTADDAATDGGRIWTARPEEVLERPLPDGFPPGHEVFREAQHEVVPRVAVLELDGGRVLQPHSVVVTGRNRFLRENCWYFGTTRVREHPLYLRPFPPAPLEVSGRLGVLATRGDVNYYHFLHDCLSRVSVLEQCPEAAAVDRWYVPMASGFQRELLDLMGIPREMCIDSTEVTHVRAEHLVVPGLASDVERNPPWVSTFLRERLKPAGIRRVPGRHLYLTRGTARNNRCVLNEAEVMEVLAPRGFESLDAGSLSVAEQIRTFGEADLIVAPHGAALANLAFCSPGSALLELFPAMSFVADYWKMASGVPGFTYQYLSGAGKPEGTTRGKFVVADITVDLPRMTAMVDALLARPVSGPTGW